MTDSFLSSSLVESLHNKSHRTDCEEDILVINFWRLIFFRAFFLTASPMHEKYKNIPHCEI